MEEVKILVVALVSFLTQEQLFIVSESAEIHIDKTEQQIRIIQNNLFSIEGYNEETKNGLDTLMQINTLREDMAPLRLLSKEFYEEDGMLNAIMILEYDNITDLRKLSVYADEEGNLSYPYMPDFEYIMKTGRIENRYVRFDDGQDVKFKMERKGMKIPGTYSLLEDWKELENTNNKE
jgi:hypothetical protein